MRNRFSSIPLIAGVAALFAIMSSASPLRAQQSSPGTPNQSQQTPDTTAPPQSSPQQPGQQPPGQAQPSQAPDQTQPSQPSAQAQPSGAAETKEFVGTVVKQGDKYVFQDADTGSTYDIDHQDEVKKFDGKKVRVHGVLDASTKTIHVQ